LVAVSPCPAAVTPYQPAKTAAVSLCQLAVAKPCRRVEMAAVTPYQPVKTAAVWLCRPAVATFCPQPELAALLIYRAAERRMKPVRLRTKCR
jgi:hypothetical protein